MNILPSVDWNLQDLVKWVISKFGGIVIVSLIASISDEKGKYLENHQLLWNVNFVVIRYWGCSSTDWNILTV